MLSELKFLSKDEINRGKAEESGSSRKEKRKSSKKKNRDRKKHRSTKHSSSDDEGFDKIKKRSKKKKWYSSEESASADSSEDDSELSFSGDEKKGKHDKKKKSRSEYSSDEFKSGSRKQKKKEDDARNGESANGIDIVRKQMGLEWMLRPEDRAVKNEGTSMNQQEESPTEEKQKANPKELNPYFRDDGCGYPEEDNQTKTSKENLLSSSLVGDGGASWRLKALKRAKEQAEREGKKLDEVVGERWGSLGDLAVSVSSRHAAPSRAHLHAIRTRQKGQSEENESDLKNRDKDKEMVMFKRRDRDYLKDVKLARPEMRAPRIDDSLSWRKKKDLHVSKKDADLISSAVSSINKFANDGNFSSEVMDEAKKPSNTVRDSPNTKSEDSTDMVLDLPERKSVKDKPSLSANQLAAKAMQLRMKGQHKEAEKLLKEAENARSEEDLGERLTRQQNQSSAKRYAMRDMDVKQKRKEDDSDVHLAQNIMKNKLYSLSGRADDEYDYDGVAPSKKSKKKDSGDQKRQVTKQSLANRIATQQERCQFCFENPNRPKHLVVAIGNFTYLMLPQRQPLVPGHCCILPLQHESATRSVDEDIWDEIRNFKKCLIMMFAKEEKDVIFLETVMGLALQRRHCLIECIPVPQDISKEAPLYFKKAIDEAEDEWSQHNAKRLIDTSQKGLRGSIPKNFPYFHVEFGLNKGFVHVIDDETQFNGNLGLNVIRGMLKLPEEDMYRKRRYETVEAQKQAVASFSQEWGPFDWTKQL
ncbi:hypothetical protein V2J09_014242 [Rumex salicifolius]